MRKLAWLVPALALAGCGTPENSPPPEGAATTDAPAASATETPAGAAPGAPPAMTLPPPGTGGPIKAGSTVAFHYVLKADGKVQQDSHSGPPQTYVQGAGQIFPAVERALEGLEPGAKRAVTLKPEDAFGPRMPDATQVVPKTSFPNADSMKVGDTIGGAANGRRITAVIQKIDADSVTLDMNHPLAGKEVTFEVEVVSVQ